MKHLIKKFIIYYEDNQTRLLWDDKFIEVSPRPGQQPASVLAILKLSSAPQILTVFSPARARWLQVFTRCRVQWMRRVKNPPAASLLRYLKINTGEC